MSWSRTHTHRHVYIRKHIYTHTLCTPGLCSRILLSRSRVHQRSHAHGVVHEEAFLRSRVALNAILAPGIRAFVARSLSVKLNSRRNSTRYTRGIPPPRACSPLVSLYTRPAKKEMPMGVAPRRPTGMSLLRFVVSLLALSSLHLPPFRFVLLYVPPWRTVKLTDSLEPISRRFCSLEPFTVLWWPRQSSRRRYGATLGPVRTW